MLIVNIFKYSLHILFYFPKTDLLKYFVEKKITLSPTKLYLFIALCLSYYLKTLLVVVITIIIVHFIYFHNKL